MKQDLLQDLNSAAPHAVILYEFEKLTAAEAQQIIQNLNFPEHIEIRDDPKALMGYNSVTRDKFGFHGDGNKVAVTIHYRYGNSDRASAIRLIGDDVRVIVQSFDRVLEMFDRK